MALFFGVVFAWLLERTNVPLKETLYALMPVPVAVPGVLFSIGWVLLLSPQIGVDQYRAPTVIRSGGSAALTSTAWRA